MKDSLGNDLKPEPEVNLDNYITEPIDYTGCHLVIAAALKQGWGILAVTY